MKENTALAPENNRQSFKLDLYFWLQALVMALVSLILVFTFVGRVIGVEGESMLPTLQDRDMLLLQGIGYTPAQGDVVVITKKVSSNPDFLNQPLVKRVIATEGQHLVLDFEKGTVTVDGITMDEAYINEFMTYPSYTYGETDLVIPEGKVFVMGDNRNHSTDSRSPQVGLVDQREVLGHVLLVLLPFSNFGAVN